MYQYFLIWCKHRAIFCLCPIRRDQQAESSTILTKDKAIFLLIACTAGGLNHTLSDPLSFTLAPPPPPSNATDEMRVKKQPDLCHSDCTRAGSALPRRAYRRGDLVGPEVTHPSHRQHPGRLDRHSAGKRPDTRPNVSNPVVIDNPLIQHNMIIIDLWQETE